MSTADLSLPAPAVFDLAARQAELQRHRGTQFDAEIVDALLEHARAAQIAA